MYFQLVKQKRRGIHIVRPHHSGIAKRLKQKENTSFTLA